MQSEALLTQIFVLLYRNGYVEKSHNKWENISVRISRMLGKTAYVQRWLKTIYSKSDYTKKALDFLSIWNKSKETYSSNAAGETKAFMEISGNSWGVNYHIQHIFVDHCVSTFIMWSGSGLKKI